MFVILHHCLTAEGNQREEILTQASIDLVSPPRILFFSSARKAKAFRRDFLATKPKSYRPYYQVAPLEELGMLDPKFSTP